MTLFEATTGRVGESYERCYVWAASEADARDVYRARHGGLGSAIRELFRSDAAPFCTGLTDHGWPDATGD
jgi:hypothetical protein